MPSISHKVLEWLGLADEPLDEEEDDYGYEEESRAESEPERPAVGAIRTSRVRRVEPIGGPVLHPIGPDDPAPVMTPRSFRTVPPPPRERVQVVSPTEFADAQEIGDKLRAHQPVIVNLQLADRDLGRRMIDFCSGLTYALDGHMEKVTDQVFLIEPLGPEEAVPEDRPRFAVAGTEE